MDCPHCEQEMELEDREDGDELYVCGFGGCIFKKEFGYEYQMWYTKEDRECDAEYDRADYEYDREKTGD